MRNSDLKLFKNIKLLKDKKIVLYGAGQFGERAASLLWKSIRVKPYCFCESNVEEWVNKNGSTTYLGIEVKGIEQIKKENVEDELLIIISADVKHTDNILSVLKEKYSELKEFYTWFGLWYSVGLNVNEDIIIPEYGREHSLRNTILEKCIKLNYGKYQVDRLFDVSTDQILIYQPGKVGSKTIEASLNQLDIKNVHIHSLVTNGVLEDDMTYNEVREGFKLWAKTITDKGGKIKIITMVREPIARSISLYFMCFADEALCNYPLLAEHKGRILIPDTYKGVKDFIKEHANYGQYGEEFEWFNEELKEVFGVDIYEYPFDKEKGYSIIEKDNIEVLVMTLEKMNENEKVICDYVGVDNFKLHNANVADDKPCKYAYKQLVKEIDVDDDIISFYFDSNKCVEHFYKPEQIEKFKKKWKRL